MDDIAVAHHVIFAFEAQFAGFFDFGVGTQRGEILEAHHFSADEPPRDIAMDAGGRLSAVAPRRSGQACASGSPAV